MEELTQFRDRFRALTGEYPFPWQEDLYMGWFSQGHFPPSCNLPTGLGKTSVVAIWLIALANRPEQFPRRLVYVVNRRTVVDQTTNEVEKLRQNLGPAGLLGPLSQLCALPLKDGDAPLAISTLRGQFADNREWSTDPARPAVIAGTVDMIGSRLLFSGYRVGFKARPLHAGFLSQDTLLIHDEAHLEPAFQKLLSAIHEEQERCQEFRKLQVMALTATSRAREGSFSLTEKEKNPPSDFPDPPTEPLHVVWRRLKGKKGLKYHVVKRDEVAKQIGMLARDRRTSEKAVLVFVRTIDDVKAVRQVLTEKKEGVSEDQVQMLTGTLRGFERDKLLNEDAIFARFLGKASPDGRTVYLICTSAGEVGIDMSADHMVCDLTPLDSMTQRLGRVNRRGDGAAEIDVVYESDPDSKQQDKGLEKARWKTVEILRTLPVCDWVKDRHDASPLTLRNLNLSEEERRAAFTPEPTILSTSDILFDSWALTTIRGKLPGRPPVEPYLHGLSPWEPPETYVAWREEVGFITGGLRAEHRPAELLEDYPIKPHELLRDRSDRVFKHLVMLAERKPDSPVWLVGEESQVDVFTLAELTGKDMKDRINHRTVLVPPGTGGLDKGFLNGDSNEATDVADEWQDEKGNRRRMRVWDDDPVPNDMRLIRTIDTNPYVEDDGGETAIRRYWRWYELPRAGDTDGSKAARRAVEWGVHTDDVLDNATQIVRRLPLCEELQDAIILAARFHDLGKKRERFQRILGNMGATIVLAKSGKKRRPLGLKEDYRHEFGSLLDAQNEAEFSSLSDEMRDLVLHLIAAHHGRGRPHFPLDEAFDPEPKGKDVSAIAAEVPRRFARLQRRYGRWGLAYLESLLRAADYAASAAPSKFVEEDW
ncbi:MAG: type I-G CRISPR-associated helicase/endonuclease Cas3g [Terriglobia bacterium]